MKTMDRMKSQGLGPANKLQGPLDGQLCLCNKLPGSLDGSTG